MSVIMETLLRWFAAAPQPPASDELIKARKDLNNASEAAIRVAIKTHNEVTNISHVLDELHSRFRDHTKNDGKPH